jgi:glutamyl-tRNA synthetase
VGKYRNNPQFKKMFEAGDRVFERIGLGNADDLNPVMVSYYEKIGYLPEGLLNALARLGWSLDDKTEFISRETLISNFTLDRVIKAPAGFDPDKLNSYQAHWMNQLSRVEKVAHCLPILIQAKLVSENPDEDTRDYVGRVIEILGERLVIFGDILTADDFFVPDDQLTYDEKAFETAFRGQYRTQWDLMMAAATVVTAPVIIIFFFAQKQFIEGITLTGIKG